MCVGIVGVRKSAGIVVVQKFARVGVLPCVRSVRVQANRRACVQANRRAGGECVCRLIAVRACRLIAVRSESACAG